MPQFWIQVMINLISFILAFLEISPICNCIFIDLHPDEQFSKRKHMPELELEISGMNAIHNFFFCLGHWIKIIFSLVNLTKFMKLEDYLIVDGSLTLLFTMSGQTTARE